MLFKDKELLICTILFANNLVNVLASALATKILIELTNTDGIFYATVIMTLMILVFGELIPKTLALSKADSFALKISPFLRFLVILLYPLTFSLNFIVYILLKIVGVNYSNFKKEEISEKREEELRGAIDLHGEDSSGEEKNMLKSILDLDEITVGSIMIPRKDIFSLSNKISYNDLLNKLEDSPHSRIPIWEKNPENITGVFHVRTLISLKNPDSKKFDIKSLCQKPWFIPESTKLDNQLMEFKKRKEHFSIVVDEYGEFLGIVTLEDIIEEIVGDIDDEQDRLKISKKVKGIKSMSPTSFLVKGNVNIRDLNKELNINLPINSNVSTVAGLVLYESRTIPKTKQVFSFFDLKFEILNKNNNQITLLKITKKKKLTFPKKNTIVNMGSFFLVIKDLFEKVLIDQRLVIIDHNSSAYEAAVSMLKNKCGALLVCDNKNEDSLMGIISERDLTFRVIPKNLDPKKTKVSKIMTKNVETIQPNRTTFDAIQIMKSKGFRHLPVVEKKKIIGILSMRDLYDYANNELQDSLKKHQEFMFGTGYGS